MKKAIHESLYKTPWVELMRRTSDEDGSYIYIREPWLINGQAVSILPFKKNGDEIIFLLRHEMADMPVVGTIKGGCDKEGEMISDTAVRELSEEAGFHDVDPSELIYLGDVRPSKLNTTRIHLFAVDVQNAEQGIAGGDGTQNEANAYCAWVSEHDAWYAQDPIIHSTMLRLMNGVRGQ